MKKFKILKKPTPPVNEIINKYYYDETYDEEGDVRPGFLEVIENLQQLVDFAINHNINFKDIILNIDDFKYRALQYDENEFKQVTAEYKNKLKEWNEWYRQNKDTVDEILKKEKWEKERREFLAKEKKRKSLEQQLKKIEAQLEKI